MAPATRAIVFDMDGVLADTTSIHEQVWEGFLADHFLPSPSGGVRSFFGRRGSEVIAELLELSPGAAEIELALRDLERRVDNRLRERSHDVLVDGARSVVAGLLGRYRLGVATSARRHVAEAALAPILELFDVLVAAEDVNCGKPAPDAYLTAAHRLAVRPEECVVVEDAVPGVRAAVAAGTRVVAVLGTHESHALRQAGAEVVLQRLSDLLPVLEEGIGAFRRDR